MTSLRTRQLDRRRASEPARSLPLILTVVVLAGVAAVASSLWDWRLLVPVGVGLPVAVALTLDALPGAQPAPEVRRRPLFVGLVHEHVWLGWTWALIAVLASVRLFAGGRDVSEAASGSLSLDNLLELGAVGLAGLTVLSALRAGWRVAIPRHVVPFAAYGLLTFLSVLWSALPIFSLGRALEFCVLAAFVAYCSTRARLEPDFSRTLLTRTLRGLTILVLGLAAQGVLADGLDYERFSWRGTHTNTAAALMLAVVLGIAFHPDRAAITRPLPWWLPPAALLPLVYETGARGYVLAGVLAFVAAGVVAAVRDQRVGAFGLSIGTVVAAVVAFFAAEQVMAFVFREQDAGTVSGLNGRRELWAYVLDNPVGSEVYGVGVGAARGGFPQSWDPQNAHSAWIDILQTLGVIGVTLMGITVLSVAMIAAVRLSVHATWMSVFVMVSSITSTTIAQPGATLALLGLAIVVVSTEDPARGPTGAHRRLRNAEAVDGPAGSAPARASEPARG